MTKPHSVTNLPAEIALLVARAPLPESYLAAKRAIAACEHLDEIAEWTDKAAALAAYARQRDDVELENCAKRIRLRAHRRMGEILKTFDARGGDRGGKVVTPLAFARPSRKTVADEAGLSAHKARTALTIADIPADQFEDAVESNPPPGTTALVQYFRQRHPQDRVRAVTDRSIEEVLKSVAAGQAAEGLLRFERHATACGVELIVEILRGHPKKLERVRRAMGFAFRLNSALDEAGNPMLRATR